MTEIDQYNILHRVKVFYDINSIIDDGRIAHNEIQELEIIIQLKADLLSQIQSLNVKSLQTLRFMIKPQVEIQKMCSSLASLVDVGLRRQINMQKCSPHGDQFRPQQWSEVQNIVGRGKKFKEDLAFFVCNPQLENFEGQFIQSVECVPNLNSIFTNDQRILHDNLRSLVDLFINYRDILVQEFQQKELTKKLDKDLTTRDQTLRKSKSLKNSSRNSTTSDAIQTKKKTKIEDDVNETSQNCLSKNSSNKSLIQNLDIKFDDLNKLIDLVYEEQSQKPSNNYNPGYLIDSQNPSIDNENSLRCQDTCVSLKLQKFFDEPLLSREQDAQPVQEQEQQFDLQFPIEIMILPKIESSSLLQLKKVEEDQQIIVHTIQQQIQNEIDMADIQDRDNVMKLDIQREAKQLQEYYEKKSNNFFEKKNIHEQRTNVQTKQLQQIRKENQLNKELSHDRYNFRKNYKKIYQMDCDNRLSKSKDNLLKTSINNTKKLKKQSLRLKTEPSDAIPMPEQMNEQPYMQRLREEVLKTQKFKQELQKDHQITVKALNDYPKTTPFKWARNDHKFVFKQFV